MKFDEEQKKELELIQLKTENCQIAFENLQLKQNVLREKIHSLTGEANVIVKKFCEENNIDMTDIVSITPEEIILKEKKEA